MSVAKTQVSESAPATSQVMHQQEAGTGSRARTGIQALRFGMWLSQVAIQLQGQASAPYLFLKNYFSCEYYYCYSILEDNF